MGPNAVAGSTVRSLWPRQNGLQWRRFGDATTSAGRGTTPAAPRCRTFICWQLHNGRPATRREAGLSTASPRGPANGRSARSPSGGRRSEAVRAHDGDLVDRWRLDQPIAEFFLERLERRDLR